MKFTIERSLMHKALSHVQSVVERRNTKPVLSNVRIEAGSDSVSLKATDLELEISERIAATVVVEGATTAPAHMLYDIIRKLPDGAQVAFEHDYDNHQLSVSAGRSRFSLACLPIEDFPKLSDEESLPVGFSLAADDLKGLIDRTHFAVSTEETRYYLNGIYLHASKNKGVDILRAAATDGHRLACVEVPLPEGAAAMPGVIVPRKAVAEVRKLVDGEDGDIKIEMSENKIRFAAKDVVLVTKLIDGTYPDYERVIPEGNDKLMDVDVKELAQAVDRVSIISERSRGVKMAVARGTLTLSTSSPEAGSATEEVECSYEADTIEIGFNYRYLLDILQEIIGDTARFELADEASPTVIRDVADQSAIYVLMPMRV